MNARDRYNLALRIYDPTKDLYAELAKAIALFDQVKMAREKMATVPTQPTAQPMQPPIEPTPQEQPMGQEPMQETPQQMM